MGWRSYTGRADNIICGCCRLVIYDATQDVMEYVNTHQCISKYLCSVCYPSRYLPTHCECLEQYGLPKSEDAKKTETKVQPTFDLESKSSNVKLTKAMRRRTRYRNSQEWYAQKAGKEDYTWLEITFDIPPMPSLEAIGWPPLGPVRATTMQHPTLPHCTLINVYLWPMMKLFLRLNPSARAPLTLLCQGCVYMAMAGPENPLPVDTSTFTRFRVRLRC